MPTCSMRSPLRFDLAILGWMKRGSCEVLGLVLLSGLDGVFYMVDFCRISPKNSAPILFS